MNIGKANDLIQGWGVLAGGYGTDNIAIADNEVPFFGLRACCTEFKTYELSLQRTLGEDIDALRTRKRASSTKLPSAATLHRAVSCRQCPAQR